MDKSGRQLEDGNKVNGTNNEQSVVQATYKKLPEEDTNWQQQQQQQQQEKEQQQQAKDERETEDQIPDIDTMVKQNGTEPEIEDEAKERMLQDNVKLSPKKDNIEVFIYFNFFL